MNIHPHPQLHEAVLQSMTRRSFELLKKAMRINYRQQRRIEYLRRRNLRYRKMNLRLLVGMACLLCFLVGRYFG